MTAYLIETCESPCPFAVDAEELAVWLAGDIEHAHYSGDGLSVTRLFRYDSGTLTPLSVHRVSQDADRDGFLRWAYEVRPLAGPAGESVATFTVRIDGRA